MKDVQKKVPAELENHSFINIKVITYYNFLAQMSSINYHGLCNLNFE